MHLQKTFSKYLHLRMLSEYKSRTSSKSDKPAKVDPPLMGAGLEPIG